MSKKSKTTAKKDIEVQISEKEEKKEFRVNAQTFALTYPRCHLSKERVQGVIKNLHPFEHIATCKENHKDGYPHLHVYVRFQSKLNIKKETHFDIIDQGVTFHPNIQGVRYAKQWFEYVLKGDNYIQDFDWNFLSPKDFQKRKADFEAFKIYLYKRNLEASPKELILNETTYKNEGKKRHIMLITDPDWGKTAWIENTFEGKSLYKANKSKYPLDGYDGEEVIIFDDFIPPSSLLLNASNVYKTLTPIGETRYFQKHWPLNQQRWMFIMLNTLPDYAVRENIVARFQIIDLRVNKMVTTLAGVETTLDEIYPTDWFN